MYTSGSTGQPKGAMIQHRGLVNYLCWAIKAYAVEGKGSVPVHSSIAFDSTVASLYPPLLTGGQIELLPEDVGAQKPAGGAAPSEKSKQGRDHSSPPRTAEPTTQSGRDGRHDEDTCHCGRNPAGRETSPSGETLLRQRACLTSTGLRKRPWVAVHTKCRLGIRATAPYPSADPLPTPSSMF